MNALRKILPLCLILACSLTPTVGARAAVFIITNRCKKAVSFELTEEGGSLSSPRKLTIEPDEVAPVVISRPAQLAFEAKRTSRSYLVAPYGLYFFGSLADGSVEMHEIGYSTFTFETRPGRRDDASRDGELITPLARSDVLAIPIKILRDESEPTNQQTWERRVRARFDEVSRIFKKHCFVQFRIVAVETWRSNKALTDLDQSFAEFERSVDPTPARVAIGFSSQTASSPRHHLHLGGTRGPLYTHLLVREGANSTGESERLEILVHELGHFLGAVHSPEPNSVMRTILGDRRARANTFRVGFDPLNTLAMCLVREELQRRPTRRLGDMSRLTQLRLRQIYSELSKALPSDPAAKQYLSLLAPQEQQEQPPRE